MTKIVVNDTNVFIDLLDAGLLEEFFHLPWEIHTTDFVMLELKREGQKEAVQSYIDSGHLNIGGFSPSDVDKIYALKLNQSKKTNVSFTDCSVWYYAKSNNCSMLTGDWKLRQAAVKDGVEVHGIIYVFDCLVAHNIITEEQAAERLRLIKSLNPRLPKDEIDKRITLWSGKKKKGDEPMT